MRGWRAYLALALMLLAIFAYVATLDESDPEALPAAVEGAPGENP
jgi:hypothetical protein